jgi:hypothetical protein
MKIGKPRLYLILALTRAFQVLQKAGSFEEFIINRSEEGGNTW